MRDRIIVPLILAAKHTWIYYGSVKLVCNIELAKQHTFDILPTTCGLTQVRDVGEFLCIRVEHLIKRCHKCWWSRTARWMWQLEVKSDGVTMAILAYDWYDWHGTAQTQKTCLHTLAQRTMPCVCNSQQDFIVSPTVHIPQSQVIILYVLYILNVWRRTNVSLSCLVFILRL